MSSSPSRLTDAAASPARHRFDRLYARATAAATAVGGAAAAYAAETPSRVAKRRSSCSGLE
jgi:hypothetical protein